MKRWNGFVGSGLIILAVTATLTACSGLGDLSISNESSADVIVSTGDEKSRVLSRGRRQHS